MRRIERIKRLDGWTGEAWLVEDFDTGDHYVVSGVVAYGKPEVLCFPVDATGTDVDFCEVAGTRGTASIDVGIGLLTAYLADRG